MTNILLQQEIMDELEFEPSVEAKNIGVAVDNGVVTLSGHVKSYAEKVTAVTAAKRVRGVRAVADDIVVRYPSSVSVSDDEIAQRVIRIIDWDIVVPTTAIQAVVRDGWVTLTGAVDWHYQRKAAEEDVRRLVGVSGVTNKIEVKPRIIPAETKRRIKDALKRQGRVNTLAIDVAVENDGLVVLEGQVNDFNERHAVENAAWSAPGVRNVIDRLVIV